MTEELRCAVGVPNVGPFGDPLLLVELAVAAEEQWVTRTDAPFFGGNDWKTYGWTMAFLALAAAHLSFGYWELTIARSEPARA